MSYMPGIREGSPGIYVLISVIPTPALLFSSSGPRPQGSAVKLEHLAGHLWENCLQSLPYTGKLSPDNISRQLLLFMLMTPVFTGVITQRRGLREVAIRRGSLKWITHFYSLFNISETRFVHP